MTETAEFIAEAIAFRLERYIKVQPTLTMEQVAEQMGVSISLVRKLCNNGDIPCIRLEKLVRIKPKDVNDYLDRNYAKSV